MILILFIFSKFYFGRLICDIKGFCFYCIFWDLVCSLSVLPDYWSDFSLIFWPSILPVWSLVADIFDCAIFWVVDSFFLFVIFVVYVLFFFPMRGQLYAIVLQFWRFWAWKLYILLLLCCTYGFGWSGHEYGTRSTNVFNDVVLMSDIVALSLWVSARFN